MRRRAKTLYVIAVSVLVVAGLLLWSVLAGCSSWDITVLPSPNGKYTFYERGTTCGAGGKGWIDFAIRPAGLWPFSRRKTFGSNRWTQGTWRWEDKTTLVARRWRGANSKPDVWPDRSGSLVVTPQQPPPGWCGTKVFEDVLVRCDEQDGDPSPRELHGP